MMSNKVIRIGARGSQLALYQAELVKAHILKNFSMFEVQIIKIKTSGDMVRRGVPDPFEMKGIFTREIEEALLKKEIDLAVHRAPDLASQLPEGLKIGAAIEREDPRDCLINPDKKKLVEFSAGARIGTDSLRRKTQLLRWYPELIIEDVYGNVDSRIRKAEEGQYDGIVLAYADIKRLGFIHRVAEIFSRHILYPAPAQGIIAVETRIGDSSMDEIFSSIHHPPTGRYLECERAFLGRLGGGYQLPCGIGTAFNGGNIEAKGILLSTTGAKWVEVSHKGPEGEAGEVGSRLAELLLDEGGSEILEKIRQEK